MFQQNSKIEAIVRLALFIVTLWSFVETTCAFAQVSSDKILSTDTTSYVSSADQLVTVRKISILPVIDNVGGIYSRPLEQHLIDIVNKDPHYDYIQMNLVGPLISPEELSSDPQKVASITSGLDTDAIISTKLTKGPNGINVILDFFLIKDDKLLAKEELKNYKRFEIAEVNDQITDLYRKLINQLPYQGLILSRRGNMVTVNLGSRDGMEAGKILSVVQIIKLTRHPKFNFLISTDKEILGKIKLIKIDDTLSFGKIVVEKERGAIQKDAKLAGLDFVKYSTNNSLSDNNSTQDSLIKRPDGLVSFGKNAIAWLPQKPPTFGSVTATIGDSLYSYTITN